MASVTKRQKKGRSNGGYDTFRILHLTDAEMRGQSVLGYSFMFVQIRTQLIADGLPRPLALLIITYLIDDELTRECEEQLCQANKMLM